MNSRSIGYADVAHVTKEVLPDKTLLEVLYDPSTGESSLLVVPPQDEPFPVAEYQFGGVTYRPARGRIVRKGLLSLPSELLPDPPPIVEVADELRQALHDTVDLEPAVEALATGYLMATYYYDKYSRFGYFALRGDVGTGKSWFLQIAASLSYHGLNMGGSFSNAAIYRVLEAYPGTLCLDEADFELSGLTSQLAKILNSGYQANGQAWRCSDGSSDYDPRTYTTYGPKIIASRGQFEDHAIESRILAARSRYTTRRLPVSLLEPEIQDRFIGLRNALFAHRVRSWHSLSASERVLGIDIFDARTQEIIRPILIAVRGTDLEEEIRANIPSFTRWARPGSSVNLEMPIAHAAIELFNSGTRSPFVAEVAAKANEHLPIHLQIKARKAGSILTTLNVPRTEERAGRRLILTEEMIASLSSKYGSPPHQENDNDM